MKSYLVLELVNGRWALPRLVEAPSRRRAMREVRGWPAYREGCFKVALHKED